MRTIRLVKIIFIGLLAICIVSLTNCNFTSGSEPGWRSKNKELIKDHGLKEKDLSGLPEIKIASNLEPANVTSLDKLDSLALYPGVNAKLFWGNGTMVGILHLAPNAKIPEEVLPADRFVFVLEGSIDQLINATPVSMISKKRESPDGTHSAAPRIDFVYLEKGNTNSVSAGSSGAKLLEVYSPVRLDYLQKAGIKDLPSRMEDVEPAQTPNLAPNLVYDLYNVQLTQLAEGAHARLVSGKYTQLSFISMDPHSTFPHHIHPEEQMMFVLRGGCNEILLDEKKSMKEMM
jgi:gluconolactonase